jgi:hypothetical protein
MTCSGTPLLFLFFVNHAKNHIGNKMNNFGNLYSRISECVHDRIANIQTSCSTKPKEFLMDLSIRNRTELNE